MEPSDSYINTSTTNLRQRLQKAEQSLSSLTSRHNRSEKALDTLKFISSISEQTLDGSVLFNRVLPRVAETLDCELALFYRIDRSTGRLLLGAACDRSGQAEPPAVIEGDEHDLLTGILTREPSTPGGQMIAAADLPAASLKLSLLQAGLTAVLPIVIKAGHIDYGIMMLGLDGRRRIEPAEEAFLTAFTTQIGAVVERMKFFDAFHQVEKLSTLGEVIAGIAHELHNPLTAVIGFSELLANRQLDPKSRSMAEKIFNEALRSKKIVDNLLVFSKQRSSQKIGIDIHAIIDEALELASYELKVTNIKVQRRFDPLVNDSLGDPHLLKQVFFNVITNAHQALLARGTGGALTVTTKAGRDTISVRFTDTGPGVPEELRTKIFEPFFTTKTGTNGTGLGLSLSQKILERHGGSIRYDGSEGSGASFLLTLPAISVPRPAAEPVKPQQTAAPFRPGNVLIVDDEPNILDLLTEILSEDRHTITVTRDAATALSYLSANSYDCILCDLKMPGMSGRDLYDRIQEVKPELIERIIFITGDFLNDETEQFMLASQIPFIKKPFEVHEACSLVNEVISRHPA